VTRKSLARSKFSTMRPSIRSLKEPRKKPELDVAEPLGFQATAARSGEHPMHSVYHELSATNSLLQKCPRRNLEIGSELASVIGSDSALPAQDHSS